MRQCRWSKIRLAWVTAQFKVVTWTCWSYLLLITTSHGPNQPNNSLLIIIGPLFQPIHVFFIGHPLFNNSCRSWELTSGVGSGNVPVNGREKEMYCLPQLRGVLLQLCVRSHNVLED